ncbi:MAG: signal peptidase I [candidate division Zixibacteria bacterium]|nr:signal peptidase I [candidate division Zixibacteria bacterium]
MIPVSRRQSTSDVTGSRSAQKTPVTQVLWEYTKSLGIALILAIIIKTSIVEAYKIPSGSMEDTLLVGDFLLANKFVYGSKLPLIDYRLPKVRDPRPGDIVIFKFPGNPSVNYIKRCVAVGGQVVEVKNKQLFVDGNPMPLPQTGKYTAPDQIEPASRSQRDNYGPYKVPSNCFFMMGDNRDNSYDSRFWGPVPYDLIQGKAMVIHWSWGTDEHAPPWTWSDPVGMAQAVAYNVAHFADRVRWKRLASVIH